MCPPEAVALASLALSAAGTAAGVHGQGQQAEAQAKAQQYAQEQHNDFVKQSAEAANSAYEDTVQQEMENLDVDRDEASRELMSITRERREAQAEVVASSQGSGLNFEALMRDFNRQQAEYADSINYNLDQKENYSTWKRKEARSQAQQRINSQQPFLGSPIKQPNYLGAGLSIAGKGFDTYSKAPRDEDGNLTWR